MTLVSCKHDCSLQGTTRLITGPKLCIFNYIQWTPKSQSELALWHYGNKSKGCTLIISNGFDQLVRGDLWINCMNKRV